MDVEKRGAGARLSSSNDEQLQSSLPYSSAKVTQTLLPNNNKAQTIQYVQQPQVMYVPQNVYKYAQIPAQAQVSYAPTTQEQQQQYEQPVQYIQQTISKSSQQQPTIAKVINVF